MFVILVLYLIYLSLNIFRSLYNKSSSVNDIWVLLWNLYIGCYCFNFSWLYSPTGASMDEETLSILRAAEARFHKDKSIRHIKKYVCSWCSKPFPSPAELRRHVRTHTGEKPFVCSVCSRAFSLKHHLKSHMNVHTPDRPFYCQHCGRNFESEFKFHVHSVVHNNSLWLSFYIIIIYTFWTSNYFSKNSCKGFTSDTDVCKKLMYYLVQIWMSLPQSFTSAAWICASSSCHKFSRSKTILFFKLLPNIFQTLGLHQSV